MSFVDAPQIYLKAPKPPLTVSVVTNTIDRAEPLRNLLRSLEHQSYPHFEVIVVVGPTRDHTLDVVNSYQGRVTLLRCENPNLSQSRNEGLKAARGDIIAYIDDDAVPSRRWLEQLVRLFANQNLDATGGTVYLIHPEIARVQHRVGIVSALSEQVDVCASRLEHVVPPGLSTHWTGRMMGTNMAYRREALLAIGGFDEYYEWVYDDTDIAIKLSRAGHHILPILEAPVYHVSASSRNRVARSYTGRWWIGTKAGIYFSIKNGLAAGEPFSAIATQSLHLIHGHWLANSYRWREGLISASHLCYVTYQELFHAAKGAIAGVRRSRMKFKRQNMRTDGNHVAGIQDGPIRPFQNEHSKMQPAINPVSGERSSIRMQEEPLRICLLSSSYPPHQIDGVGRLTNLMAKGLFALGHTVHVITAGEKDKVAFYDGAYVHQIAVRNQRYAAYRRLPRLYHSLNYSHAVYDKVKRLMLNDGIQLVDSPIWQVEGLVVMNSNLLPVVVRPTTALRQIAAMQNDHSLEARLIGELEETMLRDADFVASNSLATVKAIEEIYGVNPKSDNLAVFPYGIEPVAESEIRPFDVANPPDQLTVLFLGRLEQRKGILELFEAIPAVLDTISTVRFILAGKDNSQADGFQGRSGRTYTEHFKETCGQYLDRVQFLGQVSDEELATLYQSCDLFVAPSLYESFGLIYIEAMNYAKPVIGCSAGGIPEVVDDGVTGILVEPGNAGDLAQAIKSLLGSPQQLHDLGMAGRQQLMDKYTHVAMARSFESVYRKVIRNQAE